jgi:hypothetical protein
MPNMVHANEPDGSPLFGWHPFLTVDKFQVSRLG